MKHPNPNAARLRELEAAAREVLSRSHLAHPHLAFAKRSPAFRALLEKAVSLGDSMATVTLAGILVLSSRGLADTRRGNALLRSSLDARVPDACDLLGRCLEDGIGRRRNLSLARQAYEAGAKLGCVAAMVNCGRCYYYGIGVGVDVAKAYTNWRLAAEAGDVESMFQCGRMAEFGEGVRQNRASAKRWYAAAADCELEDARIALRRFG